jgi:SNF family Na+-dependent transporter
MEIEKRNILKQINEIISELDNMQHLLINKEQKYNYIYSKASIIKLGSLLKYEVRILDIKLLEGFNINITDYCEWIKDKITYRQKLYIKIALKVNKIYDWICEYIIPILIILFYLTSLKYIL